MGLAERKIVQGFKDGAFKTCLTEIQTICGFPLELDVDWGSIENDNYCSLIFENNKFNTSFFDRLKGALSNICSDDMGKTAMKEKVKKIQFKNGVGDLTLNSGVFGIISSLTDTGTYGQEQIQEFLEKKL